MPGIVGIIGEGVSQHTTSIKQMVACMRHEPSYTSGTFVHEDLQVALGWTCHPNSFTDCLPIWNESRDVCLIWSGENFADPSDTEHLRSRGHVFSQDRAEYLVHLYEEHGAKFLHRLNGWFSGALLDFRELRTIIFNDRYGLGRLYVHETAEATYFSSEAKALLKVLPNVRELDVQSLGEFFSCGCPLQNRTLFRGIRLLPAGSAWVFSPGTKRREEGYFNPQVWSEQMPLMASEYYARLKEVFPRVLKRYFHSPRPAAISLTGGVDSRMMMAWAPTDSKGLPSYTFSGIYRDCGDVFLARKVAKVCGSPHQVIRVGNEFLADFPRLAAKTVYVSDGMMDVSGAPDLFVNEIAKQIAPVRLTGNYGGEILRRIVAFKPARLEPKLFSGDFYPYVDAADQTYTYELNAQNRLGFVAFRQVPWHHYARLSVEQSQLTVRSPYLDNDLVSLAFQVPLEHAQSNELSLRLIADGNARLGEIGTDRGIRHGGLPGVSKLHNAFQEFTFKAEYAYDYGMPHRLAQFDRFFKPLHLERLFLGRHKFYHFRIWYRDQLAGYLRETLLDSATRSRQILNVRRLETIVKDHIAGSGNYTRELHRLLSLELIHRQLLEMR